MGGQDKMRVVCLVPSLTEYLIDLGVDVVGRTKFCIHPRERVGVIPKIGGTKNVHIDKVVDLKPDLVVANKEENVKEQVEEIAAKGISTITTVITDYDSALSELLRLGKAVGRQEAAETIVEQIKTSFDSLPSINQSCAYLIWKDPLMTIGHDTYIHNMLEKVGMTNVYGDQARYPTFSEKELIERNPSIVLLSSEPFPFGDQHIAYFKSLLPDSKVILVDGELFSWYGSRMLQAPDYFRSLHPILL